MTLGALAFLNPALLAALLALPIIYWLLRTVPPKPRQIAFPPTRILVGLENKDKTPAKTPWWLMLIRLLAAALVILALAEPVLNPSRQNALEGRGPVVLVVDNGWASAARWGERARTLEQLVAEASSRSRPLVVVATAHVSRTIQLRIEAPAEARSTVAAMQPQPFAPRRADTLTALQATLATAAAGSAPSVVWLTDGIDHDGTAGAFADGLARLAGGGSFAVVSDRAGEEAVGLSAGLGKNGALQAAIVRTGGSPRAGALHAYSTRGQRLGEATFQLGESATRATATFELPLELRNQVARVEIAGERSAGAVALLDARAQWNRIGLLSGESREQDQPLLAPHYYIEKALAPFSELVIPKDANLAAGIETVLKRNVGIVMMADIGTLSGTAMENVEAWVRKGGVLVRFAGPRLEKGGDELLPAVLRVGGRSLGGALSWSTPQPLAPFDEASMFAGLSAPADVTVSRQVLSDPARLGTDVKVWARLKDGTPLVTATRRGDGQLVLFHVTANSDWSSLPLSGLFVEMLRRIVTLGKLSGGVEATVADAGEGAVQAATQDVLAPIQTLDGHGTLRSPPPTARPILRTRLEGLVPDADHPPGYYGTAATPRAINVLSEATTLAPLPALPLTAQRRSLGGETTQPLKPSLLGAALALIFLDILAVLLLQSGLLAATGQRSRRPAVAALAMALVPALLAAWVVASPSPSWAQQQPRATPGATTPGATAPRATAPRAATPRATADPIAQAATGKVTFGYVVTGDGTTDGISRAGLSGLVQQLKRRTAVEPGEPLGVDIVRDEIAFFPILYWPVVANASALTETTLAKIDAYMKQGGMIVFDTRDFGMGLPSGIPFGAQGRGGTPLQRLLGRLDIPRLEAVPEGHVLTKSFYLLRRFPGRWDGGQLWVEAEAQAQSEQGRKARRTDGVSSILITSNDLAAAWAADERGSPLYPTVPGGELQREQAYRTGVNIVMYALTGNYKADQVHVPALLERLGQ